MWFESFDLPLDIMVFIKKNIDIWEQFRASLSYILLGRACETSLDIFDKVATLLQHEVTKTNIGYQ